MQTRAPSGLIYPLGEALDEKLNKRIHWIARCASVATFGIIMFNDWRIRKWRVFAEVFGVYDYFDPENPWRYNIVAPKPRSCYYLGQYPWYWDFNYFGARSPLGGGATPPLTEPIKKLLTSPGFNPARTFAYSPKIIVFGVEVGGGRWVYKPNVKPFGMTPFYPDVEYEAYKNQPEEDVRWYLGNTVVDTFNEQKAFVENMDNKFKNCLAVNYPKPIIQRTIKTPQGPRDWPGVPMDKLELPIPSPPEVIPPGAALVKRRCTVWFGILPAGGPEGLMARVIIY